MKQVRATCHCGAVEIEADLLGDTLVPARCTCSFCRRRQAGNVSVATSSVRVLRGADVLRLYQFGQHVARHYFCGVCGIYTHHRRRSDPNESGVNIGCIEGAEPWRFEPMLWHDGVNHPSEAQDSDT